MSQPQNITRAQLLLWRRRVLTEHASGSTPEQALDVFKAMLSAQTSIDALPPAASEPKPDYDKRAKAVKGG